MALRTLHAMRPLFVMCAVLPLSIAALASVGCDDGSTAEVRIALVRPDGRNPLTSAEIDHVRIWVRQGNGEPVLVEATPRDGAFDATLPVSDGTAKLTLLVSLDHAGTTVLFGATPPFSFREAPSVVRVPVGEPGSCSALAGYSLRAPRVGAGAAVLGTFLLVAGGEAEGATAAAPIEFFDLLALSAASAGVDLDAPPGRARAVALGSTTALVLSDRTAPLFVDLGNPSAPVRRLTLHDGAGLASGLLSLSGQGALVAGGVASGAAVATASFVDSSGAVTRATLASARELPAVAWTGTQAIVAAGNAPPAPTFETLTIAAPTGTPVTPELPLDPSPPSSLHAPSVLLVPPLSVGAALTRAFFWSTTSSWLLGLCPGPCNPAPTGLEPPVAAPESPAVPYAYNGRVLWPSRAQARSMPGVQFTSSGALAPDSRTLATARAEPAVAELAHGIVLVIGGADESGPRRDLEVCFPTSLPLP